MTFEDLEHKIVAWSCARRIIPNSTPATQLFKMFSEAGELADAEIKGDETAAVDAVGDVLVCIVNYCALKGLSPVTCLEVAYEEIKDRKGTLLPSGVFVKESQ